MNVYIHPPWVEGRLTLRAECTVTRVVIEDRGSGLEATGVEYVDAAGQSHAVDAGVVVVAAGAMGTSHLLLRSGIARGRGRLGQLAAHRAQHRLASRPDHLRACSTSRRTPIACTRSARTA